MAPAFSRIRRPATSALSAWPRDRARESDRPELPELAGPRARGARQHRAGLPGDQQKLQSLVFRKRSLTRPHMFGIITKSLKTGVLTEADPFGVRPSFGFPAM